MACDIWPVAMFALLLGVLACSDYLRSLIGVKIILRPDIEVGDDDFTFSVVDCDASHQLSLNQK